MTTTTYYNLNIVEGTDIVNPLTVDNPNYQKIDKVMHDNAVSGVTLASEIANATVHAITRENSDCAVIRFIATSNWKAGDTVTVDGVPVTALLPSGEALPDGAYVINANVLCVLTGSNLTMYLDRAKVDNASEIKYRNTNVKNELDSIGEKFDREWAQLWRNSNTSSPFVSQNVNVDLRGYTVVAIGYTPVKGLARENIALAMVGSTIPMYAFITSSGSVSLRSRECTVYHDRVAFLDGAINGVDNNDVCIPVAIYGVK